MTDGQIDRQINRQCDRQIDRCASIKQTGEYSLTNIATNTRAEVMKDTETDGEL